jgi:hypothetical protein
MSIYFQISVEYLLKQSGTLYGEELMTWRRGRDSNPPEADCKPASDFIYHSTTTADELSFHDSQILRFSNSPILQFSDSPILK